MEKQKEVLVTTVTRMHLNVRQVAEYIGISPSYVVKLARYERIPVSRIGSRLIFQRPVIDRWVAEHNVKNVKVHRADRRAVPRAPKA